ncbi:MAG: 4-vinyl reductase [Anaerolineae bacterium]|nr:4-vinyl reductase [Anaerolineae bacterium]
MSDRKHDAAPSALDANVHYYYPNRMGRLILLALEDVLGHNGQHALLHMAGFEHYAHTPPPNTTDRQFPFAAVGGLTQAMLDMYGPRGGRGVALRVGRVVFKYGLREYGPMMGLAELTFQLLPLSIKLERGAQAFAALFNHHTDQVVRLQETPEVLYWHVDVNPVCWGVESDQPVCNLAVGLLQESLLWLSGGKSFSVEEQACIACGDPCCTIAIVKKPLD